MYEEEASMAIGRSLELRQRAEKISRPLKCPLCGFRFSFRHLQAAGKACPYCTVPLGYPYWYRLLLLAAYLSAAVYVMYAGLQGENANGWLLVGLPFAFVAGIVAQVLVLRVLPPKLEAHADGSTWLKLN